MEFVQNIHFVYKKIVKFARRILQIDKEEAVLLGVRAAKKSGLLGLFEEVIHLAGENCHNASVEHIGTLAEGAADLTGAILRIDIDGGGEKRFSRLTKGESDIEGAVGEPCVRAIDRDIAAAEIEIAQSTPKALIENGGQNIATQLLGHDRALLRDAVERVAVLVGSLLADEISLQHFMEGLGKIQIHHIVILHDDVIDRDEAERIIDIAHEIEHKDLDIVLASDG